MSNKLNKLVTNIPVTLTEQEVINLSETLSAVRTAGGGGEGGHTYLGDGTYIGVDNNNNKISFLSDAANKLESVTDKLNKSDFTKYTETTAPALYQTLAGMNDYYEKTETSGKDDISAALNFKADKTDIPSIAGLASETYVQQASAYAYAAAIAQIPTTVADLTDSDDYAKKTDIPTVPTKVSDLTDSADYQTVADMSDYYKKTETSGKNEISDAFAALNTYDITAVAGIEVTTATDNHVTTFGISLTAEPVVTDTQLSGYNGIHAALDGDVSGLWNIGLTQDMLNTINGKLDSSNFTTYTGITVPNTYLTKTSADTLYQPTGDYVTTADVLTGTSNTLTGIKIDSTDYTIPTTDLSDYYTKTQVDSTFASASQLNSYLTTAQYETDSATYVTSGSEISAAGEQYALTTTGWAKVETPATFTGVTTTGSVSGGGSNNDKIGLTTTAENALTAVANKVGKPDTTQTSLNDKYLVYSTLTANGAVTGWTDFNTNVYSKTESDGRYVATADVGTGLYYSGSSPKLGVKLGTDLAFDTNGNIQVNIGGNNIVDSSHYAFIMGVDHTASGQGAFAGGYGTHTSGVGNFIHGTYLSFDCGANYDQVSNTPVFVGGTLNATTAQNYNINGGYLQIIGNGTYTGGGQGNRSDAYILYRDGTVKAKTFIAGDDTLSANYPVPKSVPNTADNTMQVQKMFVCTSDADIVAHAALANGEGCIFFRVG